MTSFQHLTVFMNIQQVKLKLTLNKNLRYRDFYFIIFHHFNSSLLGFCKINSINFAFKVKHIMMAIFSSVFAFFQIFLQYRCPWFQCSSTLSTYMNMFCWLYLSKKQLFFRLYSHTCLCCYFEIFRKQRSLSELGKFLTLSP